MSSHEWLQNWHQFYFKSSVQVLSTVNYTYYPEIQAMRKPKQLSKDVILHGWYGYVQRRAYLQPLRTVPTIVIAHTFCASPDTRISYRQCLLIQGYFCAVQNYPEKVGLSKYFWYPKRKLGVTMHF